MSESIWDNDDGGSTDLTCLVKINEELGNNNE